MSGYQQKDLTGTLFKNKRKEKETHPNATGTAMIDGVEYRVSAWTRKDKNGDPYQSLAFSRADSRSDSRERPTAERRGSQGNRLADQLSDDIPFTMEWR